MMTGQISVQDSLFPPASDFSHYHLRLYHVKGKISILSSDAFTEISYNLLCV